MSVVTFDPGNNTGVSVKSTLFGHNLEHTRSAVYQGLSAQILRNRKFAGKPAAHFGQPAEWYRIGPENVFISLDPKDVYVKHICDRGKRESLSRNETNSLLIQNPAADQTAGIGQKNLALKKGKEYQVKAVLKGRGVCPFDASVRIINASGKSYAEKSFAITSADWRPCDFTFVMSEDDMNAAFEIYFTRRLEIKIGVVSLLPVDNFYGMRRDVVDLMKETGISLLRWPGGNFAGEYNWKDGLLDVDMRAPQFSYQPVETHPHSGGYDFHEIGIDEFVALCREIGAEPYLTINLAWDSPEESAQWVEYCNGSAGTEWGGKRAARGFVKPYNVRYWSLGNEFGYGHMEGLNTPELYAEKARLSAAAMKRVDNSIIFFASGPYSPKQDSEPWTRRGLPPLAKDVSYISFHAYESSFEHGIDFVTDDGLRKSYQEICDTPDSWLKSLKNLRAVLDSCGGDIKKIGISFDEWNAFFAWYHKPCIIEGMFTALMLEMICREYDRLNMPICMYFQPVNEGAILVYPFDSELTANGQVFRLMKEHREGVLLDVCSDDKDLHCLGTIHKNSNKAILTLINRSYDREISFAFADALPEFKSAVLLDGSGPLFHGSKFKEVNGLGIKDAAHNVIIPPHSLWQAEIKL
jgi:alpha-N-arabinofuranosidase